MTPPTLLYDDLDVPVIDSIDLEGCPLFGNARARLDVRVLLDVLSKRNTAPLAIVVTHREKAYLNEYFRHTIAHCTRMTHDGPIVEWPPEHDATTHIERGATRSRMYIDCDYGSILVAPDARIEMGTAYVLIDDGEGLQAIELGNIGCRA